MVPYSARLLPLRHQRFRLRHSAFFAKHWAGHWQRAQLQPGWAPYRRETCTDEPAGVHTEGSGAGNADFNRELYFEVGKFKNVFQARDETDKLAQLGFRATAVQKGHLWANSFHVLVGPYGDEEQAKATHQNLVSSGFKPRPFEKGWRNFTLISSVMLNGSRTPEGDYTISWESYIGDAKRKIRAQQQRRFPARRAMGETRH